MSTLQTTFLKHPDAAGNQITFTSGGDVNFDNGAVYLDSTNNRLGIGTSSPDTLLDLEGTPAATTGGILRIRDTQTTTSAGKGGIHFSSSPGIDFYIAKNYDPAQTPTVGLDFGNATSGASIMRLTANGLGVGTTSPAGPLEIKYAGNDSGLFITADDNVSWGYSPNIYFRSELTNGGGVGTSGRISSIYESSNNFGMSFYTTTAGSNSEKARLDSSGRLLVGTSSVSDAQTGIASGTGWVYKTYTFSSGSSRTVTVSASFNYWVEITLTLTSNNDIAQAKTILGRRDTNPHRSATANVVGSVITQSISSSDAGEARTWTITYNHSTDNINKHFMFEVKSLNTATVSVT